MTISPEIFAHMKAVANQIGEHFAKEPEREKVLLQLDEMRRQLVDECDPVGSSGLRSQLDTIDRLLDIIEDRRREILSARSKATS